MPNTPPIRLDIRKGGCDDYGWVNVPASNGDRYGYLFNGGDDNMGGLVQTVGRGRDTAPVQLVADNRYQIANCSFKDDTEHQLSWNGGGRTVNIIDNNDRVETAKYTVNVTDTGNGNCNVPCDPAVKNEPGGP